MIRRAEATPAMECTLLAITTATFALMAGPGDALRRGRTAGGRSARRP